ncbi:MAG: hypothetical protein QME49_09980, partial [bacterium]|nr:hypothetical protein [bacterium]
SGDQGVAPKPVEIMSNGRVDEITTYLVDDASLRPITVAGIQGSELAFRPDFLRIEKDVSPNAVFYSESFGYEQSKEKKTKKGRIIGTIVGAGIGGGLGYLLYAIKGLGGLSGIHEKPSPLLIIVPSIIGGVIGYTIGDHYDEKNRSEKKTQDEN